MGTQLNDIAAGLFCVEKRKRNDVFNEKKYRRNQGSGYVQPNTVLFRCVLQPQLNLLF